MLFVCVRYGLRIGRLEGCEVWFSEVTLFLFGNSLLVMWKLFTEQVSSLGLFIQTLQTPLQEGLTYKFAMGPARG